MTRIRYSRENGMLISKPLFNGTDNLVVHLFPETMSFHVLKGVEVISEGKDTNLHSLKKGVKKLLSDLGVNFDDEVRAKKGTKQVVELVSK